MLTIKRKIRMSETDATGVLYFTNQLKYATETFEVLLETFFQDMKGAFEEYLFPIVEAHSHYLAPLRLGDEIEVTLMLEKIGASSLQFHSIIKKGDTKVGEVRIKHVLVSRTTGKSAPLPAAWKELISQRAGV